MADSLPRVAWGLLLITAMTEKLNREVTNAPALHGRLHAVALHYLLLGVDVEIEVFVDGAVGQSATWKRIVAFLRKGQDFMSSISPLMLPYLVLEKKPKLRK